MRRLVLAAAIAVAASVAMANGLLLVTGLAQNYTITVSASPSPDGTVSGGGTFGAGTSQTVVATANGGFSFVNWTESGSPVSASASYTFTLNANRTLVANFTTSSAIMPADRTFAWSPGMTSKGGIPVRNTQCGATLTPSGGDDTSAIQAAINACGTNQVVKLGAGTFLINTGTLLISTPITLRGSNTRAGDGTTKLRKTNGGHRRFSVDQTGTTAGTISPPEGPGQTQAFTGSISTAGGGTMTISSISTATDNNGVNVGDIITGAGVAANTVVTGFGTGNGHTTGTYFVSPSQTVGAGTALTATYSLDVRSLLVIGDNGPGPDNTTAVNLTADGVAGANSVTVSSGTGFAAGQFVLLDELSGASWQPTGVNFTTCLAGSQRNTESKNNSTFTASISAGLTMTVSAISAIPGSQYTNVIWLGDYLNGAGIAANTTIVSQGSQTISPAPTTAPKGGNTGNATIAMDATNPVLTGSMAGKYTVIWSSATAFTVTEPVAGIVVGTGTNNATFANQIKFVATAGATPMVAGDEIDVTVTCPFGTGQCGTYAVSASPSIGSEAMTSGGPCPTLNWAGDRVSWPFHWPEQIFVDDVGGSNASGVFNELTLDTPYPESWFNRTDRVTNEIKEIAPGGVSGNTITFTSPISITYRTSHTAQLTRYTGAAVHVQSAGVENLSFYGGGDGNLNFNDCAYCWAKNIEITEWYGPGIGLTGDFRVEIRDSYIHRGAWPDPGGAGYALSTQFGTSELLVENNIILDNDKDMVMRSSGTGSVIAYNYADNTWIADGGNYSYQEVGLNASHFTGPHHILFEGNYGQNFDSDYTHGNSIYLTIFRNVLAGRRRDFTADYTAPPNEAGNQRAAALAWGSWYDTFIGNAIGSGTMTAWFLTDPFMNCDGTGGNCAGGVNGPIQRPAVWSLGYDAITSRIAEQADPKTLSTVIRDGNYDYKSNAQHWYTTPSTFTIPSSLYLSSAPSFFAGACTTWPWFDPATGTQSCLPAKQRYDAGVP